MIEHKKFTILMISGSLKKASTNSAAIRTAAYHCQGNLIGNTYSDMGSLPFFNPDLEEKNLPPVVADLRKVIKDSDALLLSTPEYAGALPGALKNLLDWTVGGMEIVDKPTAWINISANAIGAKHAYHSLELVLRYTGANIIEAACFHQAVNHAQINECGLIEDHSFIERMRETLKILHASRN